MKTAWSTERLELCTALPSIALESARLHDRNRRHFHLGSPESLLIDQPDRFWIDRIDQLIRYQDSGVALAFYGREKSSGLLICEIQVSNIVRSVFQAAHIGYKIDQAFEGKGLMHEALNAVINLLFTEYNLHRLMANYQPENERSGRLLTRLGFEKEGYAKNYLYLNGAWCDHVLTALTNPSWRVE